MDKSPFFSKNAWHFFSSSRMDMRVGAFESPMSQLSQEFLFVFIALFKKFLHHLKVGGNPFWGDIKWHFFEISELKNHQKKSKKFFCSKFSSDCFHLFSCFPRWLFDAETPFLWSMSRHKPTTVSNNPRKRQ